MSMSMEKTSAYQELHSRLASFEGSEITIDPSLSPEKQLQESITKNINRIVESRLNEFSGMPLNPHTAIESEVQSHLQTAVTERFGSARLEAAAANSGVEIPDELSDYMEIMYMANFVGRQETQYANFASICENLSEEYVASNYRRLFDMMHGISSPSDKLAFQREFNMQVSELGGDLCPYGVGLTESQRTMRSMVKAGVESQGGIYTEDSQPNFRIRHLDSMYLGGSMPIEESQEKPDGDSFNGKNYIVVTRRTTLGVVPYADAAIDKDAHVLEKLWFILDISESSGFDQKLAEQIRSIPVKNNKDWQDRIQNLRGGKVIEHMQAALAQDNAKIIKPISCNYYSYLKSAGDECDNEVQNIPASIQTTQRAQEVAQTVDALALSSQIRRSDFI